MTRKPAAKITEEDIAEMRRLREEDLFKWTHASLAEHFGCSRSAVRDNLNGRPTDRKNGTYKASSTCGRYVEGKRNRQIILDYVNANPNCYAPQLIADLAKTGLDEEAMRRHKVTLSGRLTYMTDIGELSREPAIWDAVNSKGVRQNFSSYRYTANVTETRSVEEVMETLNSNLNTEARALKKKQKNDVQPPWITRNTDENRKPIRNPDAMGSRGLAWGIGSSLGGGSATVAL